jgi:hypothetical protein
MESQTAPLSIYGHGADNSLVGLFFLFDRLHI